MQKQEGVILGPDLRKVIGEEGRERGQKRGQRKRLRGLGRVGRKEKGDSDFTPGSALAPKEPCTAPCLKHASPVPCSSFGSQLKCWPQSPDHHGSKTQPHYSVNSTLLFPPRHSPQPVTTLCVSWFGHLTPISSSGIP